jgi:L-lysine 6-transaminase
LIFDEVQSGMGVSGKMWAYQHYGVEPDIVAFGKKAQVCGIMVGKKIDEVENNVFVESSRINSTWGANLVDMVRGQRYLEIIEEENLVENAAKVGSYFHGQLLILQEKYPKMLSNVRGKGLFIAFDLPAGFIRDKFMIEAKKKGMLVLKCGERSIRFRPSLNIANDIVDEAIKIIDSTIDALRKELKHVSIDGKGEL